MGKRKYIWWLGVMVPVLAVGGFVAWRALQPKIPPAVKKQVNFGIYYPGGDWKVAKKDIAYDTTNGTLTIDATSGDKKIVMIEEATPDQFNDVPDYYAKLITSLHEYKSLDTPVGKVYLTNPEELHGGQTAVGNNNGTAVFITPQPNLNEDGWRQLFSTMQVLH